MICNGALKRHQLPGEALAQNSILILSAIYGSFKGQAMSRIKPSEVRRTVEDQHGCKAGLVETVFVRTIVPGERAWEGEVHVFDLAGHPKANQAFAWPSPRERGNKWRVISVLRQPSITSPYEAVEATLTAKGKTG